MSFPNELNYMNNACAQSNSQFHYKDLTSKNYEHRIKLDPEGEPKIDLRNYIPNHHLHQSIIKEFPEDKNAFEKADIEWDISDQVNKHKYQLLLQKEEFINKLCEDKNAEIRKDLNDRKEKLRIELTKLIRDTLLFSKKNNPLSAMLPESINDIVKNIKEDKNINLSMNSINLSHLSGTTSTSTNKKRYESNEFLKLLGLDLVNLTPDNIKLDIDKAWNFIMSWSVNRDIYEVIRYKVVNEISSVEEKKASLKVAKINNKINKYKEQKKEFDEKIKKDLYEKKKKDLDVLEKENICSFEIDGDDKKKEKVFDSDLQPTSGDNFIINNEKIKENNFNNLEINNCSILYIGKKIKKRIKGQRYDKDGNLIFNNDDEVLRYIKDRIKEEKDMEYDNKKIKYNYFKLIKLFHGKLLYEIGLENNLDKINEILDKENVEIEHEPVMFIFKKDLNNHPKKEISDNSNQNLPDKQMKKLEKEKKELIRKIEKLQKIVDFQEKNSKKFNEYEYSKLKEDLQRMKEENKKKEYIINGLQNSINEFQNLLNNYEVKIKEYEEMYNKIEPEKDKYEKSILKLLEYNVQMINEYQKLKSQLKQQSNNNNCFNNETLKIKKADYFDILNNEDNNKRITDENNQEKEEEISTQYDIIHYDFNDVNNNDNMKTIDNFDNNNEKKKYNK